MAPTSNPNCPTVKIVSGLSETMSGYWLPERPLCPCPPVLSAGILRNLPHPLPGVQAKNMEVEEDNKALKVRIGEPVEVSTRLALVAGSPYLR